MTLAAARKKLRSLASSTHADALARFFQTGPGGYGEGDKFLGLRMPQVRQIAREYRDLARGDVGKLLKSPWHEERMLALVILADQFRRGTERQRESIYRFYLRHTRWINNWDLVDASAHKIVGAYLLGRSTEPLDELARSESLWERRIAIVATAHFIGHDQFGPTLKIARKLLRDEQDLIHKAVGWMLREVGKRDRSCEEDFLRRHYRRMPRIMLRYAIEHFPKTRRRAYLEGKV